MSEYIITVDENDERWHYVEQQYTHFFGYPIAGEIVRCRDCKFYHPREGATLNCRFEHPSMPNTVEWCIAELDGFCKWAERRDA